MRINIRIYKRWDIDLIALMDAGYPIVQMIQNALICFAQGKPCFYLIDEYTDFKVSDKSSLSIKINIPNDETETIYLLSHLKRYYKNNFCKMVLRNALVSQNLSCYFEDQNLCQLVNLNNISKKILYLENMTKCSEIRRENYSFEAFGKTITKEFKPTLIKNISSNAYSNMDKNEEKQPKTKETKSKINEQTQSATFTQEAVGTFTDNNQTIPLPQSNNNSNLFVNKTPAVSEITSNNEDILSLFDSL